MALSRMVKMYPTPTKQDNRGKGKYKIDKSYFVNKETTLQLNPNWVEWLMGFPVGWTELDASEMQSFHKSQKSLHKPLKSKKTKRRLAENVATPIPPTAKAVGILGGIL